MNLPERKGALDVCYRLLWKDPGRVPDCVTELKDAVREAREKGASKTSICGHLSSFRLDVLGAQLIMPVTLPEYERKIKTITAMDKAVEEVMKEITC